MKNVKTIVLPILFMTVFKISTIFPNIVDTICKNSCLFVGLPFFTISTAFFATYDSNELTKRYFRKKNISISENSIKYSNKLEKFSNDMKVFTSLSFLGVAGSCLSIYYFHNRIKKDIEKKNTTISNNQKIHEK